MQDTRIAKDGLVLLWENGFCHAGRVVGTRFAKVFGLGD